MIFVFGSNLAGRHGRGAAKTALDEHGAIYGQGGHVRRFLRSRFRTFRA